MCVCKTITVQDEWFFWFVAFRSNVERISFPIAFVSNNRFTNTRSEDATSDNVHGDWTTVEGTRQVAKARHPGNTWSENRHREVIAPRLDHADFARFWLQKNHRFPSRNSFNSHSLARRHSRRVDGRFSSRSHRPGPTALSEELLKSFPEAFSAQRTLSASESRAPARS